MNGLIHSGFVAVTLPGAILPRLNQLSQTQARFQSTLRVTAFEQAMEELYGDTWKERLNSRQSSYVTFHERQRETRRTELQKKAAGAWGAPALEDSENRQPEYQWRRKVEKKKDEIRWQKKLATYNRH